MKIREFYDSLNVKYDDIVFALGKEERVHKFLLKFPESHIVEDLMEALKEKKYEDAFRAAHSLKGMSINIGLMSLHTISCELTESLRGGPKGDFEGLAQKVFDEYKRLCEMISQVE